MAIINSQFSIKRAGSGGRELILNYQLAIKRPGSGVWGAKEKATSNDKEKNRIDEKALAIKQSLKYAEDLVKVYEEEKSRRKDLEIANEKIRAIMMLNVSGDLTNTLN